MRYATIEFRDSMAFLKALQLNGQLLDGVEMVVSFPSPLDYDILIPMLPRFALHLSTFPRQKSG
jgi:hypothetical protein